jgi:hypothetical protein
MYQGVDVKVKVILVGSTESEIWCTSVSDVRILENVSSCTEIDMDSVPRLQPRDSTIEDLAGILCNDSLI